MENIPGFAPMGAGGGGRRRGRSGAPNSGLTREREFTGDDTDEDSDDNEADRDRIARL